MIRRSTSGTAFAAILAVLLVTRFPAQTERMVGALREGTEELADRLQLVDDEHAAGTNSSSSSPVTPDGRVIVDVAGHQLTIAAYAAAAVDGYDRGDWPHWTDLDANGCDTREDTLIRDANGTATVVEDCAVIAGTWNSPYDGYGFTDPSAVDVDHIVPLRNAQASGAAGWDRHRREQFANDPSNLIVVSATANRSRGDKSPDQWRPGHCPTSAPGWCDVTITTVEFKDSEFTTRFWCDMSTRYAAVKAAYQLTVTAAEAEALNEMQRYC